MDTQIEPLTRRERIGFGISWLIVLNLLAITFFTRFASNIVAILLVAIAIALPLVGLKWPKLIDATHRGLMWVTTPVRWLVTRAVLVVIFFGILTPIALAMRLLGHDPLRLKKETDRDSYWEPRAGQPKLSDYFRQFR